MTFFFSVGLESNWIQRISPLYGYFRFSTWLCKSWLSTGEKLQFWTLEFCLSSAKLKGFLTRYLSFGFYLKICWWVLPSSQIHYHFGNEIQRVPVWQSMQKENRKIYLQVFERKVPMHELLIHTHITVREAIAESNSWDSYMQIPFTERTCFLQEPVCVHWL